MTTQTEVNETVRCFEEQRYAPLLSILIPSVPARLEQAMKLFRYLESICMVGAAFERSCEILMLTDNKQRSIGYKRRALVEVAKGDFVAFVDDDDTVSPLYLMEIFSAHSRSPEADVITFDTWCQLDSGPKVLVSHALGNPNEQYNPRGFKRAPWHIHAWRREISQRHLDAFPDSNYGEDWPWCEAMLRDVKTEARTGDIPLYHYRYDSKITEAR
jgi:hypothetical protein